MSQFKDFHALGFSESGQVYGQETITIGGAPFAADCALDPVTPTGEFGGEKLVQWLHIELLKSIYPAEPTSMLAITYKARTYTVRRISGYEANECAWTIDAMRTPRPGEA